MRRWGFSLLEVLISLGLLGLVLTVVIGLFLSSYSVAASSSAMTVAGQLAGNEMAALKSKSFAALQSQVTTPVGPRKVMLNGIEYLVASTVGSLKNKTGVPEDQNVLQIIVTISWQDTAVLDERGLDAQNRKAHVVHLESQVGLEGRY